jgi:hypothetical protein
LFLGRKINQRFADLESLCVAMNSRRHQVATTSRLEAFGNWNTTPATSEAAK